jgi:hypothetical protein
MSALFKPSLYWVASQDAATWDNRPLDMALSRTFHALYPGLTSGEIWEYTRNSAKLSLVLPEQLHEPRAVRINKLYLPNSIPTFKPSNSTMRCIAIGSTGVADVQFTIIMDTTTRYTTVVEVAAFIDTQLKAVDPAWSCAGDVGTQKLTMVSNSANFSLRNLEDNFKLGFTGPITTLNPQGITGNAPVNLMSTLCVYVSCPTFGRTSGQISGAGSQHIIGQVPYKRERGTMGGNIYYETSLDACFVNLPKKMYGTLEFELLDDDREQLMLNKQNWSMELSFLY